MRRGAVGHSMIQCRVAGHAARGRGGRGGRAPVLLEGDARGASPLQHPHPQPPAHRTHLRTRPPRPPPSTPNRRRRRRRRRRPAPPRPAPGKRRAVCGAEKSQHFGRRVDTLRRGARRSAERARPCQYASARRRATSLDSEPREPRDRRAQPAIRHSEQQPDQGGRPGGWGAGRGSTARGGRCEEGCGVGKAASKPRRGDGSGTCRPAARGARGYQLGLAGAARPVQHQHPLRRRGTAAALPAAAAALPAARLWVRSRRGRVAPRCSIRKRREVTFLTGISETQHLRRATGSVMTSAPGVRVARLPLKLPRVRWGQDRKATDVSNQLSRAYRGAARLSMHVCYLEEPLVAPQPSLQLRNLPDALTTLSAPGGAAPDAPADL